MELLNIFRRRIILILMGIFLLTTAASGILFRPWWFDEVLTLWIFTIGKTPAEIYLSYTIPNNQMQSFIAVSGSIDEQIIYLEPDITNFKKGDKVRITGGIFKDTEGYFMRIKGDRRVVVCLHGIAAVATAFVHPSLVEKLPQ